MILKAFAFLDIKTGAYSRPFFVNHLAEAIRMAIEIASDRQTMIGRYPQDYELVEIGSFNDDTAALDGSKPNALGTVVSYLPSAPRDYPSATIIGD